LFAVRVSVSGVVVAVMVIAASSVGWTEDGAPGAAGGSGSDAHPALGIAHAGPGRRRVQAQA
jgi:hypothetical protein